MVLTGWALGIPMLTSVVPGMVAMNSVTAIAFALAGGALYLSVSSPAGWQPRAAIGLGVLVALLGLLKLGGMLFHGLVERGRLFGETAAPGAAPRLPEERRVPGLQE